MKPLNLAKGALTIPGLSAGVDLYRNLDVGTTIEYIKGGVDKVLDVGNSLLNPLIDKVPGLATVGDASFSTLAGGASAGFFANTLLKDLGLKGEGETKTKKDIARYILTTGAAVGGLFAGTAATPYIVGGSAAYWAGKHGWKYAKELPKAAYGLVAGAGKSVGKGIIEAPLAGVRAVKNGLGEGNFSLNPNIGGVSPAPTPA